MAGTVVLFSKYYIELEGEAKSRYEQKVRMIGLVVPYFLLENSPSSSSLSKNGMNGHTLCMLTFISFINTTSYCTHEQLKA